MRAGEHHLQRIGLSNTQPRPATSQDRLAALTGCERVRRARLALDLLDRVGGAELAMSKPGDPRLPLPPRFAAPQ